MTPLVPCPACKRHVATHELACPFCATTLPRHRAQHAAVLGRVSRAAVFSAAIVGSSISCSNDKAPPAPAPPPAQQGSDDLETLLDPQPRAVIEADAAPPADAAIADAPPADAGVPDAGVPIKKKRKQQQQKVETIIDQRHMAKPYGAPPARRRIV